MTTRWEFWPPVIGTLSISVGNEWYRGEQTMRVFSVRDIEDLEAFPDGENNYHQWDQLYQQYYQLSSVWRLPTMDENCVMSFIDTTHN